MQSPHPPTGPRRLRLSATLLIAPLLLALLFAACGEADDSTGNGEVASTPTTMTTTTTTETASSTDATATILLPTAGSSDTTGTPTATDMAFLDLPTQVPTDSHHDALLQGTLIRDGDCLFAIAGDGATAEVVPVLWPHGYRLRLTGDHADLLDADGAVRASVGDQVALGGGQGGAPMPAPAAATPCVQFDSVWYAASVEVIASSGSEAVTPTATPTPLGYTSLPTQIPQTAFPTAQIAGTLVMEDGCLYLDDVFGEPGERWGVAWQYGWSVRDIDGVRQVVDEQGRFRAQVGDDVALGGGTWDDPKAALHPCLQTANVWYTSPEVIVLETPIPPRTLPLHLPTQTVAQDMDALVEGVLRPSNGCVIISDAASEYTYVIVWPQGYELNHDGERYSVVDASGATQAYFWDTVRIGGGDGPAPPGMEHDPCLSVPVVWYANSVEVIDTP